MVACRVERAPRGLLGFARGLLKMGKATSLAGSGKLARVFEDLVPPSQPGRRTSTLTVLQWNVRPGRLI